MREGGYMQICSVDVGVCAHIIWHILYQKRCFIPNCRPFFFLFHLTLQLE